MATTTYLAAIGSRTPQTFRTFFDVLQHIAERPIELVESGRAVIMRGTGKVDIKVIAKFDLDGR